MKPIFSWMLSGVLSLVMTASAKESMIFIFDKIDNQYFSTSDIDEHNEDYILDEMNININNALKALKGVNLYGEVKNTNDSVIFSKYGDIVIDSQNINLNGIVYAPFGKVEITAQNLNLNNVVIIAESIVLTCPNFFEDYDNLVLLKDTDGDGILDGDEYYSGSVNQELISDDPKVSAITVDVPVNITSSVEFDTATITFSYDETLLNETLEDNLIIL